ncbi:EspA/EspE family type VII secretion system effector [Mycobacterium sp. LTG2003]
MSALDGFYSTWNKARETFGQGTPDDGSQFDGSSRLMEMKAGVEAAAPDDRWQGSGSQAYAAANKEHASVYEKLAELDKKMAGEVKKAADVVTVGRTNLDTSKGWVESMVNSLPTGLSATDRENKLIPIAKAGITKVDDIVTSATTDMTTIKGNVDKLKGEYDTLTNQRFGPDAQNASGTNEDQGQKSEEEKRKEDVEKAAEEGRKDGESLSDGELSPEEAQRLQDATSLTAEEKAALNEGNLNIPPEDMAYFNGLSDSLDGKSPAEIRAILDGLPPNQAQAVSNALHLVGSDKVHTEPIDPSLKPGDAGYVPAQGDENNLPTGIQDVFDAPLLESPPHPNDPYRNMDEYRDIAAISQYGDPNLQRGSAINDGLLAQTRELLEDFENKGFPTYGDTAWGHENLDPTLQRMLQAASQDPTAVHDAIVGSDGSTPNNGFIEDIYKHNWADNGISAGFLLPDETDTSVRAGETMHAFDDYAGRHYKELLNITDNQSLGQINPALAQELARANMPYIDDMVLANDDGTQGFGSLDGLDKAGGDANMPVTRGLFAVIDSDPTANRIFGGAAANEWRGLIADYSSSLVDGPRPDTGALQSAGYLQRMMDQGEFLNQYDQTGDTKEAAKKAMEARGVWYDAIHDAVGFVPKADTALSIYDALPGDTLRDFFVGQPPDINNPELRGKNVNEVMHLAATYAAARGAGDLAIFGDQLQPSESTQNWLGPFGSVTTSELTDYLSGLAGQNDMGWDMYTGAYQQGLDIPQYELDALHPQEDE